MIASVPKRASSSRLWTIAISGQFAAQMPQARQACSSMTASLPSSLTSAGRGASGGRSTSSIAPKGHIVTHVSQPTQVAASTRGRGRHAAAGRDQEVVDLAGHRRGLGVDFDERLGAGRRAADEHAFGGGLGGAVLAVEDLDEAVLVEINVQDGGDALGVGRRHHARREHDEVGPQQSLAGAGHVFDLDHGTAAIVELHVGRRAAQELHAGPARLQVPVLVAHPAARSSR